MSQYWWVNHKQTHEAEISGGYIWSPKTEKNGARSQFYINLTLVEPGDIIFSFAHAEIKAIGIATNKYSEQSKPDSFGDTGENWSATGWIVPIKWQLLSQPFPPKPHIEVISPLLPRRYSPINSQGNGNQKCYLAHISEGLAKQLLSIAKKNNKNITNQIDDLLSDVLIDLKTQEIINSNLKVTEKNQLLKARIGQGLFKQRVIEIESSCRITGVSDLNFLIASHIKPWSKCNNTERLDGNNGLLLSPHIDKLFDRGWISFEDDGSLIISNENTKQVITQWGLKTNINVGNFSHLQKVYLGYHRKHILKKNS